MKSQKEPHILRSRQFSLGGLFLAVAFVALACVAAKYFVIGGRYVASSADVAVRVLVFFGVPPSLCGAVGALRGKVVRWLWYGIGIDLMIFGLILLAELARDAYESDCRHDRRPSALRGLERRGHCRQVFGRLGVGRVGSARWAVGYRRGQNAGGGVA